MTNNQTGHDAEMWVSNHSWQDDYQLSAIELAGPAFMGYKLSS
jgi:hypothetical protein